MTNRSRRYDEIAAETVNDYSKKVPTDPKWTEWDRRIAPKWRSRVGLPRLIAESVMFECLGLLRSINRGIFRNDPEGAAKYDRALACLDDLAGSFARTNWRRFDGQDNPTGSSDV
jgi:hypothetical protein